MMSTKSSVLLVAVATAIPLVSAFTCNWRGGDYSSFTYRLDVAGRCCQSGNCGDWALQGFVPACNENFYESCFACNSNFGTCCDDPYSKQYERETTTTCCQCQGDTVWDPVSATSRVLTSGDCSSERFIEGTRPDSVGEIFGCDGFNPEISDSEAAAQARAPGEWFTSPAQLDAYLEQTITCADDCWEMPNVVKNANTNDAGPFCRYTWAAACANTVVTTNARDRCGNFHTSAFTVRYDADAPVVTVALGDFTESKKDIKTKWETVPLTVTVSDNCDPNSLTSIEVFSDETPLTPKGEYSAVLGRSYANTNKATPLDGWVLTLRRKAANKAAEVNNHVATPGADGRFYTVRVCATDLAGNIGCDEKAISVPHLHAGLKSKIVPVPVDNGKLYKVASDLVYWGQAQNDLPFRLKNTGLNLDL